MKGLAAEEWERVAAQLLPEQPMDGQCRDLQLAFYAGLSMVVERIATHWSEGDIDAMTTMMHGLVAEVNNFWTHLYAGHDCTDPAVLAEKIEAH